MLALLALLLAAAARAQLPPTFDIGGIGALLAQAEGSTAAVQSRLASAQTTIDAAPSNVQTSIASALYSIAAQTIQPASSRMASLEALVADISIASAVRLPTLAEQIQSEVTQRIAKIAADRTSGNLLNSALGATAAINAGISGSLRWRLKTNTLPPLRAPPHRRQGRRTRAPASRPRGQTIARAQRHPSASK